MRRWEGEALAKDCGKTIWRPPPTSTFAGHHRDVCGLFLEHLLPCEASLPVRILSRTPGRLKSSWPSGGKAK